MAYERKYAPGTRLRMLVQMEDDGKTLRKYLDYYITRRPMELKKGNGYLDVVILDEHDPSDDAYEVRVITQGPHFGDKLWCAYDYLSSLLSNGITHGMSCVECKNGYPYAEPNFEEDKLVCWSCCDSLGWKYSKDKVTKKVTLR